MAGLGAPELLIVLVLVLLIFGGSKLPQMARSLGSAKKEFERGRADSDAPTSQDAA
jgi:sec-independent protein translocase protein TatA